MIRSILKGAAWGCYSWLAYGTIELLLCNGPQFLHPDVILLNWQLPWLGWLFAGFAIGGVFTGSFGGLLIRLIGLDQRRLSHQTFAALSIVLVFALNELRSLPVIGWELAALAISAVLATALLGCLVSEAWRERFHFLISPFVVSLLLVGGPWMNQELRASSTLRGAAAGVLLAATVVGALLLEKFRRDQALPVSLRFACLSVLLGTLLFLARSSQWTSLEADFHPQAVTAGKPNVLLITMDTVRADHLSLYGYERDTTPHLRALANDATVYSEAVATSDYSLPTHGSILTGLYPGRHGADVNPNAGQEPKYTPITASSTTLAEVLSRAGYRTGASVANRFFLTPPLGLLRGFSTAGWSKPITLARDRFFLGSLVSQLLDPMMDDGVGSLTVRRAEDINRDAFNFLRKGQAKEQPFFLFLNYMDAHSPYVPAAPFDTMFAGDDSDYAPSAFQEFKRRVVEGKRALSPKERQEVISRYDGGIAEEDFAIGALIAELKRLGHYDDTMIVITADHGEAFGGHGLMEHHLGTVFQTQTHVPLIVKYPGQHSPSRSDELVSQVDLMPTVLDSVAVALPSQSFPGKSLRSGDRAAEAFIEAQPEFNYANPNLRGFRRALVNGSFKFVVWSAGAPELYDLSADPDEKTNLYRSNDPVAMKLQARLEAWIAAIPKTPNRQRLDPKTIAALKSLGYTQ